MGPENQTQATRFGGSTLTLNLLSHLTIPKNILKGTI